MLKAEDYIYDYQSCVDMSYMFAIIMDLNNDKVVDGCEWAYACVATEFFGMMTWE